MPVVTSFIPITIGEKQYEFGHLVPFGCSLPGQGRDGADLRVRVSFQSHVFARRCELGEGANVIDEGGQPRVLCADRFEKSLELPAFCERMLSHNLLTWEAKDRNRISNMAVIDGPLRSGEHYVVIYYLFPSLVPGLDVELVVKSGYPKVLNFEHIKRRFKVVQLVKKCFFEQSKVPK